MTHAEAITNGDAAALTMSLRSSLMLNAHNIPEALKRQKCWVLWKASQIDTERQKFGKVPHYPVTKWKRSGQQGAERDLANLGTWQEAWSAFESSTDFAGVGIAMLPGFGFVALDADKCVKNDGQEIVIADAVTEFSDTTYSELSPSGSGVRAFWLGSAHDGKNHADGFELFHSKGFVTVTGNCLTKGEPEVMSASIGAQLEARCAARAAQKAPEQLLSAQAVIRHPLILAQLHDLAEALAVIPADDRELWVRMGLALKTLGDAAKPLWHDWSLKSEKYDAEDADRTWASFQPDRTGYEAVYAEARHWGWEGRPQLMPHNGSHPIPIDMMALPKIAPAQPFIIPGWLPEDTVTLFSAHGGAGKSFISLYVAICIAVGRNPFRISEELPRQRVVVYSAEDNTIALQGRVRRYLDYMAIQNADLHGWLLLLDATSCDNVLFKEDRTGCVTTARYDWLADTIHAFKADLLIFDNASDALDANENDRAAVRQFFSALRGLKLTVLLLAHVDAASSMAKPRDAKGYSGSTAWHNSARSRWFLTRDEVGLILTQPKVNYARAGSQVTLAWDSDHEVFVVTGCYDEAPNGSQFRPLLLRLIAEVQDEGANISLSPTATNNPYKLIKDRIGFPRGLERAALTQEIAAWRAEGLAEVQSYSQSNRSTGMRLVLTETGRALAQACPEAPVSGLAAIKARME